MPSDKTILISVDPGNNAGLAIWVGGKLFHAQLVNSDGDKASVARQIKQLCDDLLGSNLSDVFLVCEYPQAYRGSPVDPNTLFGLSFMDGGVIALLNCPYATVLPREWKKREKKEDTLARVAAELSMVELESISFPKQKALAHNVWDAIGIGLYALKRSCA